MAILVAGLIGCSFGFVIGLATAGLLTVSARAEQEALYLCVECRERHSHYCAHCVGESITKALGAGVSV